MGWWRFQFCCNNEAICLFVYLYLSIGLSVHVYINLSMCLSIYVSILLQGAPVVPFLTPFVGWEGSPTSCQKHGRCHAMPKGDAKTKLSGLRLHIPKVHHRFGVPKMRNGPPIATCFTCAWSCNGTLPTQTTFHQVLGRYRRLFGRPSRQHGGSHRSGRCGDCLPRQPQPGVAARSDPGGWVRGCGMKFTRGHFLATCLLGLASTMSWKVER